MTVTTLFRETVPDFIRRHDGLGVPTINIAMRFGWDVRDAYRHLCRLERQGVVRRTGASYHETGQAQYWLAR